MRKRNSGLDRLHTIPPIVNYKLLTSRPREGYFGFVRARARARRASGLLLLMWTSDTSVYDSINGRVRVHSNGTSADGHSVNYLRVWRLMLNYAYGLPTVEIRQVGRL